MTHPTPKEEKCKNCSMNQILKSKCCKAEMKTSCADEGTCCFICTKCDKPCDIYSDIRENMMPCSHPSESEKKCKKCNDTGYCRNSDCKFLSPTSDWEKVEKEIYENDDPEISEKDFEDMYISGGKNETEKMERKFHIWLENRDDDFEMDIWDFRCLQDFIFTEIKSSLENARRESRVQGWKDGQEQFRLDFLERIRCLPKPSTATAILWKEMKECFLTILREKNK